MHIQVGDTCITLDIEMPEFRFVITVMGEKFEISSYFGSPRRGISVRVLSPNVFVVLGHIQAFNHEQHFYAFRRSPSGKFCCFVEDVSFTVRDAVTIGNDDCIIFYSRSSMTCYDLVLKNWPYGRDEGYGERFHSHKLWSFGDDRIRSIDISVVANNEWWADCVLRFRSKSLAISVCPSGLYGEFALRWVSFTDNSCKLYEHGLRLSAKGAVAKAIF